jgi:hypothetical protein
LWFNSFIEKTQNSAVHLIPFEIARGRFIGQKTNQKEDLKKCLLIAHSSQKDP